MMVAQDGEMGQMRHGAAARHVYGHLGPGAERASTPIASHWYETRQSRCGLDAGPVGPTIFGRKAELHSGDMKVQEANAACRKARGRHNPADKVI